MWQRRIVISRAPARHSPVKLDPVGEATLSSSMLRLRWSRQHALVSPTVTLTHM